MSKRAEKLLKEAIHEYRKNEGATIDRSYIDLIIDLCHLMMKDKEFIKSIKAFNSKHNITYYKNKFELYEGHIQDLIFDASLYEFKEESKMNEIDKVYAINKKDLPLHIHDEWLFNSSKEIFEQRLKEG